MNLKKILVILFAILFLFGGFFLGIWLAANHYKKYEMKKNSSQTSQAPIQIAQSSLLYRDKKAKGEWDEKTLIIENLKIITGEKKSEEVYGVKVTPPHVTPIKRRADQYLKNGDDEKAKAEIRRLLKKLFPDFSKATAANTAPKSSPSFFPLAYADDRRCFDSLCFEGHTFVGGGYTNNLYIEESIGSNPTFIQTVTDAVTDSLNTYRGLGLAGRRVVVAVMPTYFAGDAGVEASAASNPFMGEQVCLTQIWGNGVNAYNTQPAYFKQVLAHEIFHCFQGDNFPRQLDGPSTEANEWWVEGTADYFSNVVYPSTNAEYIYDGDFDAHSATTPLYRMSYEANLFFQELANQSGNVGVLALITAMPTSGSFSEQQSALAGLSTMNDLFHHFAQDYLDSKIADTGGGMRGNSPQWGSTDQVNAPRTLHYDVEPFVIGRKKIHFDPGSHLFHLNTTESNPGKYSTLKGDETVWKPLPTQVGTTSCDDSEDSDYKLAQTKVASSAENYGLNIEVTQDGSGGTPPPGIDPHSQDACMRGRWMIDPSSDQSALASALSSISGRIGAGITLQNFSIQAGGCFMPSGNYAADLAYAVQIFVQQQPRFSYTMNMDLNMHGFGNYAAQSGILYFYNSGIQDFNGKVVITSSWRSGSRILPTPTNLQGGQLNYRCSADHMDVQIPVDPFPWVRLIKVRGRGSP